MAKRKLHNVLRSLLPYLAHEGKRDNQDWYSLQNLAAWSPPVLRLTRSQRSLLVRLMREITLDPHCMDGLGYGSSSVAERQEFRFDILCCLIEFDAIEDITYADEARS